MRKHPSNTNPSLCPSRPCTGCRVARRGVPSMTVYDFSTGGLPFGGECPGSEYVFTPLPL